MRKVNRIGQQYGRLIVIAEVEKRGKDFLWFCQCECGNEIIAQGNNLHSGNTKSCGCYKEEVSPLHTKTHGRSRTAMYHAWRQMIQRCVNPNCKSYPDYGGRGIQVCNRWRKFEDFLADMGDRPDKTSIDRINANGNYEPGNCRWATSVIQSRNKNSNRMETLWGRTQTLIDWTEEFHISYQLVHRRIRSGWSVEDAITTPPHSKGLVSK